MSLRNRSLCTACLKSMLFMKGVSQYSTNVYSIIGHLCCFCDESNIYFDIICQSWSVKYIADSLETPNINTLTHPHTYTRPHTYLDPFIYIHQTSHIFRPIHIYTRPHIYLDPSIYIYTRPHIHTDPPTHIRPQIHTAPLPYIPDPTHAYWHTSRHTSRPHVGR